jgi:hypothetical protein
MQTPCQVLILSLQSYNNPMQLFIYYRTLIRRIRDNCISSIYLIFESSLIAVFSSDRGISIGFTICNMHLLHCNLQIEVCL